MACPNCGSKDYDWETATRCRMLFPSGKALYCVPAGDRKCDGCGDEFNIYME